LLGLGRSSYYYEPVPIDVEDLRLQRLIDEKYTELPIYGVRRMTEWLRRDMHENVEDKRVRRMMRLMGLEAIYQKPHLSQPGIGHKIYPYLLKGVKIERPNQVWSTDITYIRLARGFVYLVAFLDWYSRYVLSWRVSVTLDTVFCLDALEDAFRRWKPDICNTDQGSQFTSEDFTHRVKAANVRISMDGRGRAFDNIFVERLWRTVKYENVYLQDYANVSSLQDGLNRYFRFYNEYRRHESLDYRTPAEVHSGATCRPGVNDALRAFQRPLLMC
jgi:putative transposase